MKKRSFVALLCALLLLAPTVACATAPKEGDSVPPNSSIESLPDSSTEPSESAAPEPPQDSASSSPEPPPKPQPQPQPATAEYIRCTGDGVNIRAGAGKDFAVVGRAEKDTVYAVTGKIGSWYKTYYRGKTAYLSASYVSVFSLEKGEGSSEKAIEEGYKHIGVPYVYGAVRFHDGNGKLLAGFTAQKFDCSSLMQYIFHKGANATIGVHTRIQVKQGKYVKPSELRRGDCIFFTNDARKDNVGIERVGHVALYLGNNYILHTASDYARIEKISAKRWSHYIEARRFT